jgi:hypothetical protein
VRRAVVLLVLAAACTKTVTGELSAPLQADAGSMTDAMGSGAVALCCSVPRVLTGLEKFDPNYRTPYRNVIIKGTPLQQAFAACNQLSAWPEPVRPGGNPTQDQIDRYMAEFMAGPNIAIVMPCWDPAKPDSSYGRWQCGGDAGKAAGCMSDGLSCGEGSACWFDPGGTNGYGCTGTVVKCSYPWN